MSSTFSYQHAKSLLSEVEKERIICTYLNSTEPNAVDWTKAADEFGSASVDSYKKGIQNTQKKIKKAMDSGVEPEAAEASPTKKGGGGRKRKGATAGIKAEAEAEVEQAPTKKKKGKKAAEAAVEEDAEGVEAPAKKKKGRKTKAQKAAEAAAAALEDDDADVKTEEDE